jgi:hypothetical protein
MAADPCGRRTSWQNIANHAQRHWYCGDRKRSDCGQGSNAKQEGPGSTAVVERRFASSERYGAQGAALEDRQGPQADRRRNAPQGDDRWHIVEDDAQEASAGEETLSRCVYRAALYLELNYDAAVPEASSAALSRCVMPDAPIELGQWLPIAEATANNSGLGVHRCRSLRYFARSARSIVIDALKPPVANFPFATAS